MKEAGDDDLDRLREPEGEIKSLVRMAEQERPKRLVSPHGPARNSCNGPSRRDHPYRPGRAGKGGARI